MDKERLVRTVEEVQQRNRFVALAWKGLQSSLNGMDSEGVFFHVQALIGFSRHLLEMLWPDEDGEPSRLAREGLGLDRRPPFADQVPALLDGSAARYHQWVEGLGHSRYVGMNVMPRGTTSDFRQDAFLRSLDPEVMEFEWQGTRIDLRQVRGFSREVEKAAGLWLRRNASRSLS